MLNRRGHRHRRSHTKAIRRRFRVVRHDVRSTDIPIITCTVVDAFCLPPKRGEIKFTYLRVLVCDARD